MWAQYRSAIYATTDAQLAAAEASKQAFQAGLSAQGYGRLPPEVRQDVTFYYAEDYHQQYLDKTQDIVD